MLWVMPEPVVSRFHSAIRDIFAPFTIDSHVWRQTRKVFNKSQREDEMIRLRAEAARLSLENRGLLALERENAELRQMLGLARSSPYHFLTAQVAARDLNSWWQKVRLDCGTRQGASIGMPVVTADGLIGRVTDVSARTADVLFVIDPGSRVSCVISRINSFGIVQGKGLTARGPAVCGMDFIARDAAVLAGDEVVTSGLGGIFPPGLLVGYVRNVKLDAGGLYQTAEILPAVDFRNVKQVFLIMQSERLTSPEISL